MKKFPIVHIPEAGPDEPGAPGFEIPWSMAEKAYETYVAALGRGIQTLEQIAARGGFEWYEFVLLYCGDKSAWTCGVGLSKEYLRHCTQRVVADLVEELTNGK